MLTSRLAEITGSGGEPGAVTRRYGPSSPYRHDGPEVARADEEVEAAEAELRD